MEKIVTPLSGHDGIRKFEDRARRKRSTSNAGEGHLNLKQALSSHHAVYWTTCVLLAVEDAQTLGRFFSKIQDSTALRGRIEWRAAATCTIRITRSARDIFPKHLKAKRKRVIRTRRDHVTC